MPTPLTGYINAWRSNYTTVSNNLWSAGTYLKNAGDALKISQFVQAGNNLVNAQGSLHNAALAFSLGGDNIYDDMYAAMHWIDDNIGDAEPLTMDAILDAIWLSDKTQSFVFINDIDAMRAAIWNMEIYEGSLAEWYRHFMYPK